MIRLTRYSEPYSATGGLAAEGVINQLGRPNIEPLEVLVREAVQNCWDAKRPSERGITIDIGRSILDEERLHAVRTQLLVDPPPGLPLAHELRPGAEILHFADFATSGLGGPTRADRAPDGEVRDFVDFVRNIGQPPDKELGGGSFGYGKAAFYIASRARTIVLDTLCETASGLERRFIACALGEGFHHDGRPFTGRHWWGRMVDEVPEPLVGEEAEAAARILELPSREGRIGCGTTVTMIAPGVAPEAPEGVDATMEFLAEALVWNFWPRMISTPGGEFPTMTFRVSDAGRRLRLPDPRYDDRLRGFVEAMDRLRSEPDGDEDLVIDREIDCLRPIKRLGRLVIQKGPVAPTSVPDRAVPQGARQMADAVHHVALMRNAELVVKYLRGPESVTGRFGYSGVFRCAIDVDQAFRDAEPPTHDNWVYRAVPPGHARTFVKVALERIVRVCREAAGYDASLQAVADGGEIPLGEFADALATLMPSSHGPGARRPAMSSSTRRRRRHAPGRPSPGETTADVWMEGTATSAVGEPASGDPGGGSVSDGSGERPVRMPQIRAGGDPRPAIAEDGRPVLQYPFELRGHGSRVRLSAAVEVMTNDGAQVETDAPRGFDLPAVTAWLDPHGTYHPTASMIVEPDSTDGTWVAEVPIADEAMMRVNVEATIA